LAVPAFDSAFWQHWSDGNAELSSYAMRIPRYGELRTGRAVAIFVKEPFSLGPRVKADGAGEDTFEVMKLNFVNDFQTGVYDYNTMTSAFVSLEDGERRQRGMPTKISYSAQEWCGHVYHHLLFDQGEAREALHSYFSGEADKAQVIEERSDGVSEDALLLWARGMAAPSMSPGESAEVSFLDGLQTVRFAHRELQWWRATLKVAESVESITVPAGTFEVRRREVNVEDVRTFTFYVEEAWPHRIVRMTRSDGFEASLVGTDRMPYWQLHDEGDEANLSRIGM